VITIIVGLVGSAASTEAASGPWRLLFDLLKWPVDGEPAAFQAETFAVNAILGSVMVGWATLMYLVVAGPIARGNRELVRFLLVSLGVWFVVDSSGSLLAGLPGNIILNVGFLGLFLPPLLHLLRAEPEPPHR
jgi:hypothetical protein